MLWGLSHGDGRDASHGEGRGYHMGGEGVITWEAQLSSIWPKGCILMTVCVFYLT